MNKLLLLFILSPVLLFANTLQEYLGLWQSPKNAANKFPIMQIYQENGKLFAVGITHSDFSPRDTLDSQNPNPNLRNRPLNRTVIVSFLTYSNGNLINGEIYNPQNGNSYYIKGQLTPDQTQINWFVSLDRGGIFGKNIYWDKVQNPEQYSNYILSPEILTEITPTTPAK